jgi:hypothetical protein
MCRSEKPHWRRRRAATTYLECRIAVRLGAHRLLLTFGMWSGQAFGERLQTV